MNKVLLEKISGRLKSAQQIVIFCHLRPDGDAIGSLLGLGLSLQAAGKQVQMVSVDGVPSTYRFLTGFDQVVTSPSEDFDFAITVDCSDIRRVGKVLDGTILLDLNIDHHITNENFAEINLVDPEATATAEILAKLIREINLPLGKQAAAALLTGIVTDTLGFRTSNITPTALRIAADLMEYDLNLIEIYERTLVQRSYEAARFWAAGLNRIERRDGVVWTSLTLADRRSVQYPGKDDADLINVLSSITSAQISVVFVEQSHQRVKVSWRARPGLDVSQVARAFGGGGHPAAAGAEINGSLDQAIDQVLQATMELVKINEPLPEFGS